MTIDPMLSIPGASHACIPGRARALSRALAEGITRLAIPAAILAIYVVVAAVVGVLTAVGPARRATNVVVLQAVTVE